LKKANWRKCKYQLALLPLALSPFTFDGFSSGALGKTLPSAISRNAHTTSRFLQFTSGEEPLKSCFVRCVAI